MYIVKLETGAGAAVDFADVSNVNPDKYPYRSEFGAVHCSQLYKWLLIDAEYKEPGRSATTVVQVVKNRFGSQQGKLSKEF